MLTLLFAQILAICKPNILFILSDDVGWNDLDVHGSPQIPTPNFNNLCSSGVRLTKHYGQLACSPTRATLMSGRNAINTGIYTPMGIDGGNLDLSLKIMPQYFNELGYESHMSGKWHLGLNTVATLPTSRGFDPDTFIGMWIGSTNQFTHRTQFNKYNFVDGVENSYEYDNEYALNAYTNRVINTLKTKYNRKNNENVPPFFYYFAPQNNHVPLLAPDKYFDIPECANMEDERRGALCAMTVALDEAVGNITKTLDEIGQLSNTIIVYTTDNGGVSGGSAGSISSNYPLRGSKFTLWEGGLRTMACISGPTVPKNKVWDGLMHTSDWLPTLLDAVEADVPIFKPEDGVSVWHSLTTDNVSPRNRIVFEAHRVTDSQENGNAMIEGDMKIIKVVKSNRIMVGEAWSFPDMKGLQDLNYTVKCDGVPPTEYNDCSKRFCMFNLTEDPCEYNDLRYSQSSLFEELRVKFNYYRRNAMLPIEATGCLVVEDEFEGVGPCDV